MIDIYADGGCFLGVCIPYDVMLDIMKGDFVKDALEFEVTCYGKPTFTPPVAA